MRRTTLLTGVLLLCLSAIPSSAAIVFYSSEAAWLAAHTSILSDDFGTGAVSNWFEITNSPSYSSPTGATITNEQREMSNGAGNWNPGPSYIYGPGITPNLGSGRYLDPGSYYQDFGAITLTGEEVEHYINGAWVYDSNLSSLITTYPGSNYQYDKRLTLNAPAGQNAVAFQTGTWTGGDRAVSVTVATVGGVTQTYYGLAANLGLTFFGFGVDNGDTISSVVIQGLFAPIPDTTGLGWTINGDTRSRTFDHNTYVVNNDNYRLVIDNLAFGLTQSGGGDPGNGGGDPPPASGGEVPEASTFLLAGSGLLAAGLCHRKKRG